MNVRLSANDLRVRIDPADLAALAAGSAVAFEVAGPMSLRCELACGEGESSVVFGSGLVRVTLDEEQLARLADPDVEEIAFARPIGAGRELRCEIEKDRRTFAPRHKPARGG
jgi:hypothetical protein